MLESRLLAECYAELLRVILLLLDRRAQRRRPHSCQVHLSPLLQGLALHAYGAISRVRMHTVMRSGCTVAQAKRRMIPCAGRLAHQAQRRLHAVVRVVSKFQGVLVRVNCSRVRPRSSDGVLRPLRSLLKSGTICEHNTRWGDTASSWADLEACSRPSTDQVGSRMTQFVRSVQSRAVLQPSPCSWTLQGEEGAPRPPAFLPMMTTTGVRQQRALDVAARAALSFSRLQSARVGTNALCSPGRATDSRMKHRGSLSQFCRLMPAVGRQRVMSLVP